MSDDSESSERDSNPLAGVLDRLLNRERGGAGAPAEHPPSGRPPAGEARPAPETGSKHRRMLPVAGMGRHGGDEALRSAAQWAALLGRRPVITDLCCGESVPETASPTTSLGEGQVPRARVPCELDRVQREPADVVLALLERLRQHEQASDLLLVRVPIRQRRALMRAAFLSGALVVPVHDGEEEFRQALEIAREVLENFLEISVWPFSSDPGCLERFISTLHERCDVRAAAFDPGRLDLAEALAAMQEPPPEGFLVALLAPEPAALPEGLLRLDTVEL